MKKNLKKSSNSVQKKKVLLSFHPSFVHSFMLRFYSCQLLRRPHTPGSMFPWMRASGYWNRVAGLSWLKFTRGELAVHPATALKTFGCLFVEGRKEKCGMKKRHRLHTCFKIIWMLQRSHPLTDSVWNVVLSQWHQSHAMLVRKHCWCQG